MCINNVDLGKCLIKIVNIFGIKSWHKKSYFHRRTCFRQTMMDFKFFLNLKKKMFFFYSILEWFCIFYNKSMQIFISARERKQFWLCLQKRWDEKSDLKETDIKWERTLVPFELKKKGWNSIGNLRFHVFYFIWLIH